MYRRHQTSKKQLVQSYLPQAIFASLLLHAVFLLLYIPNSHLLRTGKIVHAPLIITLAPRVSPQLKQSDHDNKKGQDAFSQPAKAEKVKSAAKSTSIAQAKKTEKPSIQVADKPTPIKKPNTMVAAKPAIRKKAVVIEHPPIMLTPEKILETVVEPSVEPTLIVESPPTVAIKPEVAVETKVSQPPKLAPKLIEVPQPNTRKKAVVIEHPAIVLTPEKIPEALVEPELSVEPTKIVESPPTVAQKPNVETGISPLPDVSASPVDTVKPIDDPQPTIVPLPEIAPQPEPVFVPLPESAPVAQSSEQPNQIKKPEQAIAQSTIEPEKSVLTPKPDPEPKKDIKVMAKPKIIEEPPTFTVPEEMANVPTINHASPTKPPNKTDEHLIDNNDQRKPNLAIPRDLYATHGGALSQHSQPSNAGGATDMMSHIKQQREARAMQGDPSAIYAQNNAQQSKHNTAKAAEHTSAEQVKTNIIHNRGMFKITTLRQYEGTFSFKGWRGNYSNTTPRFYRVETFDARVDIRLLMVNKMIDVIQHDYKGEFQWQSNRFSNIVTLSADPKYHGELQQFLLDEFKPEFDALQRP